MPTKTIEVTSPSDGHTFEVEIELKNTDLWDLGASGAGVIAYHLVPEGFKVLLAKRAAKVGPGLGITGGGFCKLEDIKRMSPGSIVQSYEEAYQEACEENKGFETVIPFDWFEERAQAVPTFLTSTPDENSVHTCVQFALGLNNPAMWDALKALPPGDDGERVGDLIEALVTYDSIVSRKEPEKSIKIIAGVHELFPNPADSTPRFFHPHEPHAIGAIAWHAKRDKLWRS